MPVDLIVFTADRRIQGAIPLADDRISDMLNSVPRIVMRGAVIEDLLAGTPPRTVDLTLAIRSTCRPARPSISSPGIRPSSSPVATSSSH